jgi:hypothetical protein
MVSSAVVWIERVDWGVKLCYHNYVCITLNGLSPEVCCEADDHYGGCGDAGED